MPAADRDSHGPIIEALERVLADIPASGAKPADRARQRREAIATPRSEAGGRAVGIARAAARARSAFMTVLPDLYLIWQTQRQMVADIFGVYGRSAELTRTHMLYCLFRHAASQVLRDVAVRGGQRMVIRQLSGGALRSALGSIGMSGLAARSPATRRRRWIPLAGAAAVGAYAYWDTLQVARTAQRLLTAPVDAIVGRPLGPVNAMDRP